MNAIQIEYIAAKEVYDADFLSDEKAARLDAAESNLIEFAKERISPNAADESEAREWSVYIDSFQGTEKDEFCQDALKY